MGTFAQNETAFLQTALQFWDEKLMIPSEFSTKQDG